MKGGRLSFPYTTKVIMIDEVKETPSDSFYKIMKRFSQLSRREAEISTLIHEGLATREIANKLYISERTVENHRSNIRRKLQLTNESLAHYLMTLD
jgi:DNA-binding NarL/FixJ family response regulator